MFTGLSSVTVLFFLMSSVSYLFSRKQSEVVRILKGPINEKNMFFSAFITHYLRLKNQMARLIWCRGGPGCRYTLVVPKWIHDNDITCDICRKCKWIKMLSVKFTFYTQYKWREVARESVIQLNIWTSTNLLSWVYFLYHGYRQYRDIAAPQSFFCSFSFCALSLEDIRKHNWVIQPPTLKVSGKTSVEILYLMKHTNARLWTYSTTNKSPEFQT